MLSLVVILLTFVDTVVMGECDATSLAHCQTEDIMKCDRPCQCMVKYGVCMRNAGCEWNMYKDYVNACHHDCRDGTCDAVHSEKGPAPIDVRGTDGYLLFETPIFLSAKYGHQGSLMIPALYANSTDNLEELVTETFAHFNLTLTSAIRTSVIDQLTKKFSEQSAHNSRELMANPRSLLAKGHELLAIGHAHADNYASAYPFPHIAFSNFFQEDVLGLVADECEAQSKSQTTGMHFSDQWTNDKTAYEDEEHMGEHLSRLLSLMKSSAFIHFLERLSGIYGLIPDPHNNGGGLHVTQIAGHLKVHTDFNTNYRLQLERRVNVFVYLNRNWTDAFGGHLELWDKSMSACHIRILPLFNRLVVFSTTNSSFHGHPDPLTAPQNRARLSVAQYYYTNGRPADEKSKAHTTVFRGRPDHADETDMTFFP